MLFLISKPQVDWNKYFKVTENICTITKIIDQNQMGQDSVLSFLSTLHVLCDRPDSKTPIDVVRTNQDLLKHINLSLVYLDTPERVYRLLEEGSLKSSIIPIDDFRKGLFITGSLLDFRNIAITLSESDFVTDLVKIIESEGFGQIFSGYKKRHNAEGKFLLEKKQ